MPYDAPDYSSGDANLDNPGFLPQRIFSWTTYYSCNINAGANIGLGSPYFNSGYVYHLRSLIVSNSLGMQSMYMLYAYHKGVAVAYSAVPFVYYLPEKGAYTFSTGDHCYIYMENRGASNSYYYCNFVFDVYPAPAGWSSRPTAYFTVDDSTPAVGQTVTFTDASVHTPTSWSWNFGDGSTSTLQNPTHAYSVAGWYSVTLVVRNAYGTTWFAASINCS